MKLILKDFRCYSSEKTTDETIFDFGEEKGITLLTGQSGNGKSTILLAIYFALYGEGKKLISYGKTSCSVTFYIDDLIIIRTKHPNFLKLKIKKNDSLNEYYEYDGNSAQCIITERFGTVFNISGYISQNMTNSFVLMSSTDKLKFLEQFAFKDVDLGELRGKCKAIINTRYDNMMKSISQLELVNEMLKNITKPENMKFPIRCTKEQQEKVKNNEEIKIKNSIKLLSRNKDSLEKRKNKLTALKLVMMYIQGKKEIINQNNEKSNNIHIEKSNIKYIGNEKMKELKSNLYILIKKREYQNLKKEYSLNLKKIEIMKNKEIKNLQTEKDNITNILWNEYKKEEIKDIITNNTSYIYDLQTLQKYKKELLEIKITNNSEELQNKLNDYKTKLNYNIKKLEEIRLKKEIYKCPSCKTNLRFSDNKLYQIKIDNQDELENLDNEIKIENEIKILRNEIKKIENEINENEFKLKNRSNLELKINDIISSYETLSNEMKLEDIITEYKQNKKDIEYLREYENKHINYEERLEKINKIIKDELYSSSYIDFKKDIDNQLEKLNELEEKTEIQLEEEIDEEELRYKINEEEIKKEKLNNIEINIKEIDDCNELLKNQIIEKEKNIEKDELTEEYLILLNKEINDYEKENEELEKKKNTAIEILSKIEIYNNNKQKLEEYEKLKDKVIELTKKEKEDRELYTASTLLREIIGKAENTAMLNIIECINTHVSMYIDYFFPDNAMSVKLTAFKETKKCQKSQINIEIIYKGNEVTLDSISGGELSRIILAYSLSLNEMNNVPILMLDEVTSSLDEDNTTIVFDAIKENIKNKHIICVAHQVIQGGMFTKIINL
jgi:exonuclease SbcC